jgi:G-patch domain
MASDDEDDYLSAKFLDEPSPASSSSKKPKTYSDIRKDAQKRSQLKQEQNRRKSRKERELEAREEGLSKSLFERAKEEEEAGLPQNKALSMMMKMGFKPGQSLGASASTPVDEEMPTGEENGMGNMRRGLGMSSSTGLGFERVSYAAPPPDESKQTSELSREASSTPAPVSKSHLVEPLPLLEWKGMLAVSDIAYYLTKPVSAITYP